MNRSAELIDHLAHEGAPDEIIIAPGAPPVTRSVNGVQLALNIVLDPGDVADTLIALRERSPTAQGQPLAAFGTFSFGVRDVGRLRVSYSTQRGSKAFRVIRVPFTEPETEDVCEDSVMITDLAETISSGGAGLIGVFGPSAVANATFVYAVLRAVNGKARKVIHILERSLTYLMAHDNSIVIQAEVGSDVETMEDGVRNALLLDPDILYIGDICPSDAVPSLAHAVESCNFTIVSSVSSGRDSLLQRFRQIGTGPDFSLDTFLRQIIKVAPRANGKVAAKKVE